MASEEGGRYASFTKPPTYSRPNTTSTILNRNLASDIGSSSSGSLSSRSLGHRSVEVTGVGETCVFRSQESTMHINTPSTHGGVSHHESALRSTTTMEKNGLHQSGRSTSGGCSNSSGNTSTATASIASTTTAASFTTGVSSGDGAGGPPFCFIPCDDSSSSPHSLPTSQANALLIFGLPWYAREKEIDAYLCHLYPTSPPLTTRLYSFPHNGVSRGICFVEYPVEVELRRRGASSFSMTNTADDHLPYGRRRQRLSSGLSSFHRLVGHSGVSASSSSASSSLFPSPVEVTRVDLNDIQHRIITHPWDNTISLFARCYCLPMNSSSANHWDRSGTLPPLPMDPPQSKALVGYGEEGRRVRCGATLEIPNTCTSAAAYNRVEMCRKRLRHVLLASNKARSVPSFLAAE